MGDLRDIFSERFSYAASGKSALLVRFWGQSGLYGIILLLTRLGNFLLLPLYWSKLRPWEFGILAVAEVVGLGLTGVLTLCLEASVTRSYHEWSEEERPRQLGAIWIGS